MVWGCILISKSGNLVKIDKIMKKEEFDRILENNVASFDNNPENGP